MPKFLKSSIVALIILGVYLPAHAQQSPQARLLRDAGIELDLPAYYPEALRHPQKIFSGRTIKISLQSPSDIKKMRLELENKTAIDQPRITLSPKNKILALLKEKGREPAEFKQKEISFEIPFNIETGSYNLKLFLETQKLKEINIDIEGSNGPAPSLRAERNCGGLLCILETLFSQIKNFVGRVITGSNSFKAAILNKLEIFAAINSARATTDPAVYSRTERRCGFDRCPWETILAGQNDGPEMVLVGLVNLFRKFGNWSQGVIDNMFFGNNPPFYYYGDPKSKISQEKFYLAGNVEIFMSSPYPPSYFFGGGAIYIGCLADSQNCSPGAYLIKGPSQNFPNPPPEDNLFFDYPKIALDRQNSHVYISAMTWSEDRQQFFPATLFISGDMGEHFEEIHLDLGGTKIQNMETGNDNKLYVVTIENPADIVLYRLDSSANVELRKIIHSESQGFFYINPAIASTSERAWDVNNAPAIAIDKSNGPYKGRIYVIWSKPEQIISDVNFENQWKGINFDIFLNYSDDQGSTWSGPIKINDDMGEGNQNFPSIDVDGNGIVNVAFFDHRDNQDLAQFDVYYAYSEDGGLTFSRNLKVNQRPIPNPIGGRAWGDYFDLVHGETGQGMSWIGYPCIDDSYSNDGFNAAPDPATYLNGHKIICIDQINTQATIPPQIDIGLKFFDVNRKIRIAAEPEGTVTSPLRIRKGAITYGIKLVDINDPTASRLRIQTASGIKALKKL